MKLKCDLCGRETEYPDLTEEELKESGGYFVMCDECGKDMESD